MLEMGCEQLLAPLLCGEHGGLGAKPPSNNVTISPSNSMITLMQGVILKSHLMVKELLEKTKTTTGLTVIASIADKIYTTGKGYAEGFKKNMKIKFDEYLGKWNYRAVPTKFEKA